MPSIYLAHPISLYGSDAETRCIQLLERRGFAVVNPADLEHEKACGRDMARWCRLAARCDALAFMTFDDGAVSAGVAQEIETMLALDKPVYPLFWQEPACDRARADESLRMLPHQWPGAWSVLSVEATRARLRPFREAGLRATPSNPLSQGRSGP